MDMDVTHAVVVSLSFWSSGFSHTHAKVTQMSLVSPRSQDTAWQKAAVQLQLAVFAPESDRHPEENPLLLRHEYSDSQQQRAGKPRGL